MNSKTYVGKHQTLQLEDNYMGSGKLITRAIKKHGIENFKKEILFVFDTEEEMNQKEKELVIVSEDTYNLCPGGHGGFGYINDNNLHTTPEKLKMMNTRFKERYKSDPELRKVTTERLRKFGGKTKGLVKSPEAKAKVAAGQRARWARIKAARAH